MPQPLTVGTAGHIDHGKTALVHALTGRHTDRLPEERQRGLSIELGFANLDLGDRRLSLVDVPGHERFVRTMIAGATGIDMFLLVVAADDGPMPQTLEHLAVLKALGVEHGALALSKTDLVDASRREHARRECTDLFPTLSLVEVNSQAGNGIDELRTVLGKVAEKADLRTLESEIDPRAAHPVLHIDRAFTIVGRGTIVTGTLWSGRLEVGQRVTLLPEGLEARIRSLQIHDRSCKVVASHQRVALNLAGVSRDEVRRGDVISTPSAEVRSTYRLDVDLLAGAERVLAESRAQVHLGTRDSPARIIDLRKGRAQLRLEQPLLARSGDRFVVRRIAPPGTLGGGIVRDPSPPRHGANWLPPLKPEQITPKSSAPVELGPFARQVLVELAVDGARPRGAEQLAAAMNADRRNVEIAFKELAEAGEVVRAKADIVYTALVYKKLAQLILALTRRKGSTTIAAVRDSLGISRKYAQALLEQLDSEHRLRRDGDHHYLRE